MMRIIAASVFTMALVGKSLSLATDQACLITTSESLPWTISNFEYSTRDNYTSPGPDVFTGTTSFVLKTSSIGYRTECWATSTQRPDYFYGDVAYSCSSANQGDSTSFTFDWKERSLKLTQSWVCGNSSRVNGYGEVKLELQCSESYWSSKDSKGEETSTGIKCQKYEAPVRMTYFAGPV
jgi:hypothetical protein